MSAQEQVRLDDYVQVVFFTGAGISKESGVPTYRGAGGIWKSYDYERYACQAAFDEAPERVWEFHDYRRELVGKCQPNRGHAWIAELQRRRAGITVVTQNIDGLHQLAGSEGVLEVHGSLWRVRCDACRALRDDRSVPFGELRCPCGEGNWRPDITWFGDPLNEQVFGAAIAAALAADLVVTVGTSGVVFPAAQIPLLAAQHGAMLVEVNPEETALSQYHDVCLRGSAADLLPTLAS
ncbi:MAG: NAD-dependent deacetylase [Planctomycetota bacterium]